MFLFLVVASSHQATIHRPPVRNEALVSEKGPQWNWSANRAVGISVAKRREGGNSLPNSEDTCVCVCVLLAVSFEVGTFVGLVVSVEGIIFSGSAGCMQCFADCLTNSAQGAIFICTHMVMAVLSLVVVLWV